MLLQDAYTYLSRRTALDATDTTSKARMRDAMGFALKEMYRRCKFMAMLEDASFDTVDGTSFYYLDDRALFFTDFRDYDNGNQLDIVKVEKFNRDYPTPSTTEDKPTMVVPIKKVWCNAQPSEASALTITSNGVETSDVNVYVRGISSSVEKSEKVTLAAGNFPHGHTTNSYTEIISISKDPSVGTIAVTADTGTVSAIVTLFAADKEKTYWKVRLYPTPDASTYTIKYSFYRNPWETTTDEDVLAMDERFTDSFLEFTTAYLLQWQGDQKWQSVFQLATQKLQEVMDNDYFGEDEDIRMGLIELDQDYNDWR